MPVEIFDETSDPSTSLHIAIYNEDGHIIPAWWLELPTKDEYDLNEIAAILDCIPSIAEQLEKLLEHFS